MADTPPLIELALAYLNTSPEVFSGDTANDDLIAQGADILVDHAADLGYPLQHGWAGGARPDGRDGLRRMLPRDGTVMAAGGPILAVATRVSGTVAPGRPRSLSRSACTASWPAWASRCHHMTRHETMHPEPADLHARTVTDSRVPANTDSAFRAISQWGGTHRL